MKKVTVKFKKPTKLEQRKPEHAQKFSGSREKKRVSPKSPILTALFLQKKIWMDSISYLTLEMAVWGI